MCLSSASFRNPKVNHEHQSLNLEQVVQFVLSTGSDSDFLNFLREKKPMICKYYIHLFFFVHSLVYISSLLFCLCSVVRRTQKFNFKLLLLIAFVMSLHGGKMLMFYSKLEVNMVFSWASSSTFSFVSSFNDSWLLLF